MSDCEATPEVKAIIRAMAKNRVEAGHTDPMHIVDAIHAEIQDHTPLWKSEIADIVSGYAGGGRKRTASEIQIRVNAMKAEMRDLSRTQDTLTGKIVDKRAETKAAKLRNEIDDLQRRVDYQQGPEKKAKSDNVTNPEIEELARKKAELKAFLDDEQNPPPATRPKDPNEAKNKARQTQLLKDIAETNRRIDQKDYIKGDKPGVPLRYTPEVLALKAKRDALHAQLEKDSPQKPKSVNRNEARQAQLKRDIAKFQDQLKTGDYSKPERIAPIYDKTTRDLEKQRDAVKSTVDREIRRLAYASKSPRAKLVDTAFAFRRAIILSSVKTLGKLTSAATVRGIMTPVEQAVGSALRHVPGLKGIAAQAPREGAGFSPSIEGSVLKRTFSADTAKQMKDTLLTASGSLDKQFGKDKFGIHKYLDMVGQMHGALKTPAKLNEFYRSVDIRTQHATNEMIAMGMTPAEVKAQLDTPESQAMIGAKAYIDAKRAIFMSDNAAIEAYKVFTNYLKNAGKPGSSTHVFTNTAARVLEYLLPIVKIPTNFVAEGGSYAVGGLKAIIQGVAADGHLTPDQADYIMRNLKKQTVGAAMLALGYMVPGLAGGYYQKNDHPKKGQAGYGEIQAAGLTVPKWLVHAPFLEPIQMGATMAKIVNSRKKGEGTLAAGALAGVGGMVGEIPFFDTPKRLVEAVATTKSIGKYLSNELGNAIIPPDVQNIAKMMDKKGQVANPQGFWQTQASKVPVLRQQLPTKPNPNPNN